MLIVGLGNIGTKYDNTRHNFGFMLADALLEQFYRENARIDSISGAKFKGICHKVTLNKKLENGTNQIYIIKPQTYMNLSGESVQPFMAWHDIKADNLLVLHDELDIPYGDIRLKTGGGLAGHNGLKSIAERLSTQDFHRLRLGIGRPENKEYMANYVLSPFSKDEQSKLDDLYIQAFEKVNIFLNKKANSKLK